MAVDVATINAAMKVRFSNDLLGDLTNQDDETWTIIKEAVLDAACADGIEEYQTMTGCTYGEESIRENAEINLICSFTIYKLYEYAQNTEMMADYEKLLDVRVNNFKLWGNTFDTTNKAHAADHRPHDYKGYRSANKQVDSTEISDTNSPYIDPGSPFS